MIITAFVVFSALVFAVVGGWWLRGAVRMWRGGSRFSAHPIFRVQGEQRRENIDRCAPTVAVAILCDALIFACLAFLPGNPGNGEQTALDHVLSAMVGFAGLALFGSAFCAIVIRYYNRPRFLVPPSLRSAPGVAKRKRRAS